MFKELGLIALSFVGAFTCLFGIAPAVAVGILYTFDVLGNW